NLLDTGSLVVNDLHNSAHSSASQMGFSYSSSSSAASNMESNAMGAMLNVAVPQGSSDSSDTQSSIAQGTIIVRDNPDQDLSGIDRSATALNGNGVSNDFDVDKIKEKQALGQAAGYVGMRTVGEWAQSKQKDASDRITAAQNAYAEAQANGDEAGMQQALADGNKALEDFHAWDAGSTNTTLLHMGVGAVVADLGGGNALQGALGAGGSEVLTPLLVNKLGEQNLPWAAALVGGVLGDGAGAATAIDGAQYNYLSHKQKDMEKQEKDACGLNVACLAQVNAKWSAISGEQNIGYAVGVGAGLGIGAYDMGTGIIKAIGSPAETLAGVKAILNDPAFRASVGDALADEYAERVDRMATAYEDAGWDGSVTAGVEVGRLIFDVAGAVEAAGGVAKLGVSVTTKAGKVIGEVGEAIKSGALVQKAADWAGTNYDFLIKAGGVFGTDGKPLMSFKGLTNAQKGVVGEVLGGTLADSLVADGQRIGRLPEVGQNGIDDLLKVNRSDVDYVVIEYKFGSSTLKQTADGLQMSDDWLLGTNTGRDRILQAVGERNAQSVVDAMDAGRVEKWVVHTDPYGKVTIGVLGKDGKLMPKQISSLFGSSR
ncbi:hemagglutinin-related protein, partial [Rhodanobacter fulvus Jip2]